MWYSRSLLCVGLCLLFFVAAAVKAESDHRLPPIFVDCQQQLTFNHCDSVSYTFKAVHPRSRGHNEPVHPLIRYRIKRGPGSIDPISGYWSMSAGTVVDPQAATLVIEAYWKNQPRLCTKAAVLLLPQGNQPFVQFDLVDCGDTVPAVVGEPSELTLSASDGDFCDQPALILDSVVPASAGEITLSSSGSAAVLSFLPAVQDQGMDFTAYLSASDGSLSNDCFITFAIAPVEPEEVFTQLGLTIGTVRDQVPGEFAELDITLDSISAQQGIGGFDLLIGFDSSALALNEVFPGAIYDSCGWEYFTYHLAGSPGLVRIVGLAETNNGDVHPSCGAPSSLPVTLARIRFLVGSDSAWQCSFAPVRFYWTECANNGISSASGAHFFGAEKVFELQDSVFVELPAALASFPGYGGLPTAECSGAIRSIICYTGGVGIACPEPVADARGDVDLNQVPFELPDARLFANYFTAGTGVFTVDPPAQTGATDINEDSTPLKVEDYVLLFRRAVALDSTDTHPAQSPNVASFFISSGMLLAATSDSLGALYVVLSGNVAPQLMATTMSMSFVNRGGQTHVLVYPRENFPNNTFFVAGPVLRILAPTSIVSVATATKRGGKVTSQVGQSSSFANTSDGSVPEAFELAQNYPNPFNGETVIGFNLPHADRVSFDVVNILGKVVYSRTDELPAGPNRFTWDGHSSDGSEVASGVYYYRLSSDSFNASRKMVLLK